MNDYNELIESLRSMDPMVCSTAADAIESLQSRVAELESRLEISPLHNVDGIMARDATIKLQDERIAELEAEREKQKPVAWYCDGEDGREYNGIPQMSNGRTGTPLYAAPPVAAPVRLTDSDVVDLFQVWNTTDGASHADLILSVETAVLRANGFKVEGEQ